LKPWEAVDVDGPISVKERVENLLKRKELLEVEIKRIKAATQLRKKLTAIALQERLRIEEEVMEQDKAARTNNIKKKKKAVKSESKIEDAESNPRNETGENAVEIDEVLLNEREAAPSSKLHSKLANKERSESNAEVEVVAKEVEEIESETANVEASKTAAAEEETVAVDGIEEP
jgi:hypothetical protein